MTETATSAPRSWRYWAALVLVGALGGLLSGAFGVGGGIIMVPLLIWLARMDQRHASATSLLAILPTAIVGAIQYGLRGEIHLLAAVLLAAGGIVGAIVGARLLKRLPLAVLRWLFIALLVVIAARLILVPPLRGSEVELSWYSALALVGIGLLIGVASGLFGIGGGVIAVPVLIALFGFGDLLAKGTSLAMMVPTSISGTVTNIRNRLVDVPAGLVAGAAAFAASFGGVALAFLLPPQAAGIAFGIFLLAVAAQLSFRAVRAHRAGA
ncbi:sulfite exporter TauE/SafE family protein [soil metagenome]